MLDNSPTQRIEQHVRECLGGDTSGHDIDHINRVHDLAMQFAAELPQANAELVSIAAMLHDVDDYKLVGRENASKHLNSKRIMGEVGVLAAMQSDVIAIIDTMGYKKSLEGIRPQTLEGMIVSDADMCDAVGANGIVRCLQYAVSNKGNGMLFRRNVWPHVAISAEEYNSDNTTHDTDSFINHFFEKLLKLPTMMLTEPGRLEAAKRDEIMTSFLRQYFIEQQAPEWVEYLDRYLESRAGRQNNHT